MDSTTPAKTSMQIPQLTRADPLRSRASVEWDRLGTHQMKSSTPAAAPATTRSQSAPYCETRCGVAWSRPDAVLCSRRGAVTGEPRSSCCGVVRACRGELTTALKAEPENTQISRGSSSDSKRYPLCCGGSQHEENPAQLRLCITLSVSVPDSRAACRAPAHRRPYSISDSVNKGQEDTVMAAKQPCVLRNQCVWLATAGSAAVQWL